MLRELTLIRTHDNVGIADIAVFPDGTSVLHWRPEPATTEVYPSVIALKYILEGSGQYRLADTEHEQPEMIDEDEMRQRRRDLLEYAERNGWMTLEAQAELAAIRRNDGFQPPKLTPLDDPEPEELEPLPTIAAPPQPETELVPDEEVASTKQSPAASEEGEDP